MYTAEEIHLDIQESYEVSFENGQLNEKCTQLHVNNVENALLYSIQTK